MKVSVADTGHHKQVQLHVRIPEGDTVTDAITQSVILKMLPEIDLNKQKFGIFGKLTKADTKLNEGDRVEIYRAISADPATVKRGDKTNPDQRSPIQANGSRRCHRCHADGCNTIPADTRVIDRGEQVPHNNRWSPQSA